MFAVAFLKISAKRKKLTKCAYKISRGQALNWFKQSHLQS